MLDAPATPPIPPDVARSAIAGPGPARSGDEALGDEAPGDEVLGDEALGDEAPIEVLIVGAGFSGLAMALECERRGLDWRLVEAHSRPGGTWTLNRYPGAACDVPSHLYRLARRPHGGWSRPFAPAREIEAYLAGVAAEPALAGRIRYGTRMRRAGWRGDHWAVALEGPRGARTIRARRLALATGMLHAPRRPDLPGLDLFGGPVVHTAEWNEGLDWRGKRVAVIGTGASAIQLVPELARDAAVTLYQRSPPWVVGKRDAPFGAWARRAGRLAPARALWRQWLFGFHEMRHMVWRGHRRAVDWAEGMARREIEVAVADPALRDALLPGYRIGCKRILQSADYYATLAGPNAELVTGGIERVTGTGIVAGGRERPHDLIVLATGFRVAEAAGLDVAGPDGTLAEAWARRPLAHLGTYPRGFPNLAVLLGPGTALGHNSVVLIAEAQARHAARLWSRAHAPLQPKAVAQAGWADELDRMAAGTVWGLAPGSGGCQSWYHDRHGRPSAVWPGTVGQFRRRLRRAGRDEFEPV